MDHQATVIIDNGSGQTKAGFANQDEPNCCFPTIVGRPKVSGIISAMNDQMIYVGDDAQAKRGILNLKYPIENGIINNWEDMMLIWQNTFNQLKVDPMGQNIFITETHQNPQANRQKMAEIFLEGFNVHQLYVSEPAQLSLIAAGKTTGIVVDCGDGVTCTVPVREGRFQPQSVLKRHLAGRAVTNWQAKIFTELGIYLPQSSEMEIVREIKEKLGYVALDYEAEFAKYKTSTSNDKSFKLPDDQIVTIKNQRFRGAELLFKPSLDGSDDPGVHEMTLNSIMNCDEVFRQELCGNIVISGGSTMFPGFAERLQKEIIALAPSNMKIRVVAPKKRKYLAWIGGSIVLALSSFQDYWITREQYKESGPSILFRTVT